MSDNGSKHFVGFRSAGFINHFDALIVRALYQPLHVWWLGVHHSRYKERTMRVAVQAVCAHLGVHVRDVHRRMYGERGVRNAGQICIHVIVPSRCPVRVRHIHVQEERQINDWRRVTGLRRIKHDHVHWLPGGRVIPVQ